MLDGYRKRQCSQWEMPPENAFVVCRQVNTSLSSALCQFTFYETQTGRLVTKDCGKPLQDQLIDEEPHL
jgi:hypothetical protein